MNLFAKLPDAFWLVVTFGAGVAFGCFFGWMACDRLRDYDEAVNEIEANGGC